MAAVDPTPTQLDLERLSEEIERNVAKSSAAAASFKDDFCEIWPTAKQALELLSPVLSAVPGVSIFAKAAIAVVISAGDAAHRAMCSK